MLFWETEGHLAYKKSCFRSPKDSPLGPGIIWGSGVICVKVGWLNRIESQSIIRTVNKADELLYGMC